MNKTKIILVNLGTPSSLSKKSIRHFLKTFLSDKRVVDLPSLLWLPILYCFILPFRSKRLVQQYQDIWLKEGAPLHVYMKKLAEKLECSYAMSYSSPFLQDVIQESLSSKVENLIIVPLYPQYASSSTGAVYDQVFNALEKQYYLPGLKVINNYHNHPTYIRLLTESVKKFWADHGQPHCLVMSFHGIPQRCVDKGDPYASQCQATALALAQALHLESHEWILVYQSRFGKAKWLQPFCDKTLATLPQKGIEHIHLICPGFSVDCLETLEEIAKTNKEIFLEAGGKSYEYIPALNDSDAHCELIRALTQDTLS